MDWDVQQQLGGFAAGWRRFVSSWCCRGGCGRGADTELSGQELLTAAGKPAEGPLDVFLGEPRFETQVVFEGDKTVREPYLAVAMSMERCWSSGTTPGCFDAARTGAALGAKASKCRLVSWTAA
jgi:hypothetical protein